ncbi:hypothetical protein CKAH01_08803 [Colletotrichum kahawae]|uniref:Uncharacterized protein n=1 Tax=Colletotrichum kahawae TaxID=34407 RepID=A0AAD9Y1V6_COLKA|nr:hypothetical protein CKAH01_08803 [Colletotrichum kahawae]
MLTETSQEVACCEVATGEGIDDACDSQPPSRAKKQYLRFMEMTGSKQAPVGRIDDQRLQALGLFDLARPLTSALGCRSAQKGNRYARRLAVSGLASVRYVPAPAEGQALLSVTRKGPSCQILSGAKGEEQQQQLNSCLAEGGKYPKEGRRTTGVSLLHIETASSSRCSCSLSAAVANGICKLQTANCMFASAHFGLSLSQT